MVRLRLCQDLTQELRDGSLMGPADSDDGVQFQVFLEVVRILFCIQVLGDLVSSSHGWDIKRDAHRLWSRAKRREEGRGYRSRTQCHNVPDDVTSSESGTTVQSAVNSVIPPRRAYSSTQP